jgi:hypothetical protein
MKEETTNNRLRIMDVRALTILRNFGHTNQRKLMMVNLDQLASYEGTAQGEQP